MKVIKKIFISLILFIALVCLGLWITGYGYILVGLTSTYLVGKSGPAINERHIFENRTVSPAADPYIWQMHEGAFAARLNQEQEIYLSDIKTASFLVIKNDKILFEKYWDEYSDTVPTNSFSVAKSIVSLLVGVAVNEGKIISIDQPVADYLSAFKEEGRDKITIRHLLAMSSGLKWSESGSNPFSDNARAYYGDELEKQVLNRKVVKEPGKYFEYLSGDSQLLAMVLESAVGMNLSEYASLKLWKPMGASYNAYWNLDHKDGIEKAFCCFYATPRDFALIGKLIQDGGRVGEIQLVDAAFLAEAFKPGAPLETDDKPNSRYGLHWWLLQHNGYDIIYARGILGQYIISIPREQLIIVRTGSKRKNSNEGGHPEDVLEYVNIALYLNNLKTTEG
ncbi:MAG: serine hydrolase domain-containing protein [Flavobacteriales bacterium]